MKRLIIGLTGAPSAGKDTVATHLSKLGFTHISTSGIIREEMRKENLPLDRSHVSHYAIKSRHERGPDYLAKIAASKVNGNAVISGLRNIKEVEFLREEFGPDFVLITVEAPIETRYKWALERKRVGDDISFDQFKAEEDAERNGDEFAHQVDALIAMADKVIVNDGTRDDLLKKTEKLVHNLENDM